LPISYTKIDLWEVAEMVDQDYCSANDDKLKVRIRQTEDGRKKKIKLKNDFMDITIRVKDCKVNCEDNNDSRWIRR
jgi:hypothetical protein